MKRSPDPADPGANPGPGPTRRGLPRDERPATAIAVVVAAGGMWGFLGYTVLWEGQPFAVTRVFVNSVPGVVLLLPVRIVIWGIRAAEELAGRPFDLSSNNLWIAFVASTVGAAIALAAFLCGTWAVGWLIRRRARVRGLD